MASESERFRTALAQVLGLDPATVDDATSPQTVKQWNSMTHMKLVARLEGEFGVRLGVRDVIRVKSAGDFRRLLAAQGVDLS
jgi:acyl carrier protein